MGCVGKGLDIFIDRHAPEIERTKISLESAGDVAFPEDTGETLVMSPVSHYTRKWKSIHCKKKEKSFAFLSDLRQMSIDCIAHEIFGFGFILILIFLLFAICKRQHGSCSGCVLRIIPQHPI